MIEVFNRAPESVIGIPAFGEKAVDVGIPPKRASKGMKDTNETGDKIFRFVQGEKEFLDDIGNSLKETVKQGAVFKEKMAEGFSNSEDQVPVGTINQFKGHGSRPVIGILGPACRAKFGMTAKRNKFKVSIMGTAIHGTTIGGIPTVDYFFDVFIFNNFIIIFEHLLYHIHEIIMKQSRAESKPLPLKIEGQGS